MAEAEQTTLPDYPFFEVDGITAAFGCSGDKYVSRTDANAISRQLRDESRAFTQLFFKGGSLADHGFRLRPQYAPKGHATIRGLMCSFEPSHEAKEATVALAIYHWCDRIEGASS